MQTYRKQTNTTVNQYIVPMTMGDQATTMQNVYQSGVTTARGPVMTLGVVSLQRDLDRLPVGVGVERELSLSDFASMYALSKLKQNATQPDAEEGEEVVIDTDRVLTAERASHEWQQMTEPAGPGVQLPSDIEG